MVSDGEAGVFVPWHTSRRVDSIVPEASREFFGGSDDAVQDVVAATELRQQSGADCADSNLYIIIHRSFITFSA